MSSEKSRSLKKSYGSSHHQTPTEKIDAVAQLLLCLVCLKKNVYGNLSKIANVNRPPKSNRNVVFHQESGCKDRNFFNPIQNIRAYFCKKNA
jgi:hypothetical protein